MTLIIPNLSDVVGAMYISLQFRLGQAFNGYGVAARVIETSVYADAHSV